MISEDKINGATVTFVVAFVMASYGSLIGWWARHRVDSPLVFNALEFIGEYATGAFSGIVGFMLVYALLKPVDNDIPLLMACIGAAGITGHMGSRFLFKLERSLERKLSPTAEDNESNFERDREKDDSDR